ncbi:MAG: hypothetical protein DCC65_17865 [Planctomycetota bacterium]|nr:MAG: hypothetical protein DCC65_17865 [Planctomycetota bacterium]
MQTDFIIMGGLIVVAIGLIIYSLRSRDSEKAELVRRRTAGLEPTQDVNALQAKAKERVFAQTLERAAPMLSRPVMPTTAEEQSKLRAKMMSAGYRRESAPVLFLACKTLGGLVGGGLAALYAMGAAKEMNDVLFWAIGGLGMGFMLPQFWLSSAIKKRMEAIRNGLPDSLDLMVVAVESGLGLDAAILRVSDEMGQVHPALAEEFQIATVETQMGVPRSEALTRMADRTAVQEMKALVAVITQAEKLGTSIAKALRNQAESLRTKRRQRAEERAQKTAVKLLIPLVLFIFPAIFVVVAGPAVIHLMKTFNSGVISK